MGTNLNEKISCTKKQAFLNHKKNRNNNNMIKNNNIIKHTNRNETAQVIEQFK